MIAQVPTDPVTGGVIAAVLAFVWAMAKLFIGFARDDLRRHNEVLTKVVQAVEKLHERIDRHEEREEERNHAQRRRDGVH